MVQALARVFHFTWLSQLVFKFANGTYFCYTRKTVMMTDVD